MRSSGNAVTPIGVLGDAQLGPQRPSVMPWLGWKLITLPAIVGTALLIVGGFKWLQSLRTTVLLELSDKGIDRARVAALGLFALANLMVLLPRCAHVSRIFDRYLLPLMPALLIPLLLAWQWRRPRARIPTMAWVLLIVYGLFAIAITQEVHALARARVAAAERLRAAGIGREQIDAGYEYNAWTELLISGYYHDSRIRLPEEARSPSGAPLTPNVRPRYRVEFASERVAEDEMKTEFGEIQYFVYLPPMHRTLVIREKKPAPVFSR